MSDMDRTDVVILRQAAEVIERRSKRSDRTAGIARNFLRRLAIKIERGD